MGDSTSTINSLPQSLTRCPVEQRHSDYLEYLSKWKRCRDVAAGQDAVHKAGALYLPMLADQSDDDYKNYKMRAGFFNATWRTIVGLQGMLFRQEPKITVPDDVKLYLDDIDLKGTPFMLQLVEATEEALKIGRLGLLVDFPQVAPELADRATMQDAKTQNLRPTIGMYLAESIINWQVRVITNRTVLSQVRLEECVDVNVDEFTTKKVTQWRVLDLVDTVNTETSARGCAYRVRVFQKDEKGNQFQVGRDIYPTMNNKTLDYIPFYFIGPDSCSWECDDPPMIDLVDVNLQHYRTKADYEHGCHFTGLPTPYIAGHRAAQDKNGMVIEKYYIGSTTAWVFPNKDTQVGFLEFTGQGLASLEKNLESKEKQMAVLGARMLEPQIRGVESAETAAIHRSGENSMLAAIAQSMSLAVRSALVTFVRWCGVEVPDGGGDVVEFDLNRDFVPIPIKSDELTAFVTAWQKGAMSFDTLFENLQRREVFAKDQTAEDELSQIDAEGPRTPAVGMPGAATSLIPGAPAFPGATKTKTITGPKGETYSMKETQQ